MVTVIVTEILYAEGLAQLIANALDVVDVLAEVGMIMGGAWSGWDSQINNRATSMGEQSIEIATCFDFPGRHGLPGYSLNFALEDDYERLGSRS